MVTSPVDQVWPCGKGWKGEKEQVGRRHQGMDRPGVRQVPERTGEMEETGRQIICASPTTIGVKGQMMVMMMEWKDSNGSVCNITYIT